MKNVVIVSSSLHAISSSKLICEKIKEGLEDNGNQVKFVDLKDVDLKFCIGCLACQKTGKCVINDDVKNYLDDISNSDVLIFASPIYYYSITGQLKTFLDRLSPVYIRENKFKKIYLVATCADTDENAKNGSVEAIQGFVNCFDGVEFGGYFLGTGIEQATDLDGTNYLENAYLFGKNI